MTMESLTMRVHVRACACAYIHCVRGLSNPGSREALRGCREAGGRRRWRKRTRVRYKATSAERREGREERRGNGAGVPGRQNERGKRGG